jgi:hypothetical protein
MSSITAKPYCPFTPTEKTPLGQKTPSLLHRICCCACRIIPNNQKESQNSSYGSTQDSFLQRLRDFNAYSIPYSMAPCEIDYTLWNEFNQAPALEPLRQHFCVLAHMSETGG